MGFSSMFVSFFGLFLGLHTLKTLCFRLHFNETRTHRLQYGIIFAVVAMSLVLRTQLFLQIFFCVAIFLTPLVLDLVIFYRRARYFRQEIVSFLDGMLLQMRLGRSFKEALQNNLAGRPLWFEKEFRLFLDALVLKQSFSGVIGDKTLFVELEQVATASVKQIERLKSLRRKLKIEDDFRQKSSKALLQVRMQSVLLSLMYVPLVLFQIFRGALQQAPMVLLTSSALFIAGSLWIASAGRRYKWKT